MQKWAAKAETFIEDKGASPRGRDRSDEDWVELQAIRDAGNALYDRLRGQAEEVGHA